LELKGYSVEAGVKAFRKSLADAKTFTQLEQDFLVNGKLVEVKSRNLFFTRPQDYPYETCLVDTVEGYNAKEEKPLGYIIVSTHTGAMLWLDSDVAAWQIDKQADPDRGIEYAAYVAPKRLLRPLGMVAFGRS
jgi:hypothetical protein